jgi:peptide/nickel transport system substrate-binding protein
VAQILSKNQVVRPCLALRRSQPAKKYNEENGSMKISRRQLLGTAAAATAASVLPFGIGSAYANTPLLKVIPHADLKIVDPIWTTGYISRNHGYMIYDTLFAMDAELNPQPQMVDTYETSSDGLVWTFKLRDGLAWHDGPPVTAEDCVVSLTRWGKRDGMGQRLFTVISKLEAADDKTIVMTLSKPYGLVLQSLGKISSNVPFMMPKRIAETDASEQIKESIGSGPFIFKAEEWVPGSKVVYIRNEKYVPRKEPPSSAAGGKVAKADRVEWITIGDPTTAMNALVSGEVDYWEQVPPDLAPLVDGNEGVKTAVLDNLGSMGMARFNSLVGPTANEKLRLAIAKGFKQVDFLQSAIGNPDYFKVSASIYPAGSTFASDAGAELVDGDMDAAKKMVAESGYKGEKVVVLQSTDNPILSAFSLVAAEKMRAMGINVDLQAMDWSTVLSRRASKDDMDHGGWSIFFTWWIGGDSIHPLANVQFGGNGEKGWFGWANDDQLEQLRNQFAEATDPAKQKEIAAAVQKRIFEIASFANLGTFFVPCGYSEQVTGMIQSPVQFFWNMDKA